MLECFILIEPAGCVYNYGIEIDSHVRLGGIFDEKIVRLRYGENERGKKQPSKENANMNLYYCDKMQSERGLMTRGMRDFGVCNKIIHLLSSLVKIIRCIILWWKRSTDNEPTKGKKIHTVYQVESSYSNSARTAVLYTLYSASHIFLFYFGENAIIKIIVFTTLYETVTNTFYSLRAVYLFFFIFIFGCSFSFGSNIFFSIPFLFRFYLFIYVCAFCASRWFWMLSFVYTSANGL